MKFTAKYFCICLLLVGAFISSFGQNRKIDSLKNLLRTQKEDTNKVNTLNGLCKRLWRIGLCDSALLYADKAENLAEKLNYKEGTGDACNNLGIIYSIQGNYPNAMKYYHRTMDICQELGNKNQTAIILGNIGNVYFEEGDYSSAMEYQFKALSIHDRTGNKKGSAINYGSIGNIYEHQKNYPKALEYDSKALSIYTEIGNKYGEAANLGNIGIIYGKQANYPLALQYEKKALAVNQEIGNKTGISQNYSSIGLIYEGQKDYPESLDYYFNSLKTDDEIGDRRGAALNMCNIAIVYTNQKNYKQAKIYLDSAIVISKDIGEKEITKSAYSGWASLDSCTGNYKAAFADYKNYILYRDSLMNEAITKKTVQAEMNYQFEQKQAAEKAEQDKKDAVADQERKKQIVIRNSFIGGFVLMLTLAFFIFRGYRQKHKTNIIVTQQKEEVEKQKVMVEQQKALVEEKNKDILDSITYAKRLQDAILPPLSLIKQCLPESFVLYKPKDIVAGDFYWMERSSLPAGDGRAGIVLLAAADCTGHGVPGALVSVVCSNALNRTVKEFHITEPGKILDKVRELVVETFSQSDMLGGRNAGNIQDGMDISLCSINTMSHEVQWSGAFNSLWYIHDGAINEVLADKQPIGYTTEPKPFNTCNLKLHKGDALYLFTDGYADQFGGPKGKKFKYKQMQEILLTHSHKPMEEQKTKLEDALNEWMGSLEQVDDVLVVGIRV